MRRRNFLTKPFVDSSQKHGDGISADNTLVIKRGIKHFIACLILVAFVADCSSDNGQLKTFVEGTITVADSIDNSRNYAGIGVTIIKKDSANASADTLFHALTNKEGKFSGTAMFPERRQYVMYVSRNGKNIGRAGVILAKGDAIKIKGELPGLSQTLQINSKEHDILAKYRRVEKGFQRVGTYARSGRLKGDSLVSELQKWPDIYWQIYEENPNTLVGNLSAKRTVELLHEWDKTAMMQKVRQIQNNDDLVYIAATYGKEYVAGSGGLDRSLAYLDTLEMITESSDAQMRVAMERIDVLYDSARVEDARTVLASFKKTFKKNKAAEEWAASIEYDLNYLSPGDPIPEFTFESNGNEISREKLKGRPYLLEITSLLSPVYQQQFERTIVIHSIYKNYDFQVITIPIDTSKVMVEAFFEERMRPWPVAPANSFNAAKLQKMFNIKRLPTRFLVNKEGRIVRRYVGNEYEDVIQGIQQIMNKE